MAGDLKAVVEITADTTGLIKGVDGAMKKLETASGMTAAFTGIEAATRVIGFAEKLFNSARANMDDLDRMALTWSPQAISAQMQAEMAKIEDERKIGEKMGKYTAAHIAYQSASDSANAQWTANRADALGAAKNDLQNAGTDFGSWMSRMGTNAIFDARDLMNSPLDLLGNGFLSVLLGDDVYNRQSDGQFGFSDSASIKINDTLESIERLLKGK